MSETENTDLNQWASAATERIHNLTIFDETCAGHQAIALLADKWAILLIYALSSGRKRYSDLQRLMPSASPKMLTSTLRELETRRFVQRDVFAEVPPRVEYSLTPLGEDVMQPLSVLCEWAQRRSDDLKAIRADIEARAKANRSTAEMG